ncbi:MAG: glycoside hydrolase N-terminal domain-containing protein, partial [Planctomycetia bacterium]
MSGAWLLALAGGVLWSPQPAQHFTQSYPVGNGRLGALVFGGTTRERIVLNESSMWSGSVENPDRAGAHE